MKTTYDGAYFADNRCCMKSALAKPFDVSGEAFYAYREVQKIVEFKATDDVLDLGCGLGHGSWLLAQRVKSVVGVDIAEQNMEMKQQMIE